MKLFAVISLAALGGLIGHASAAELSSKEEKEAKKIYLNKCSKCHELYDPKSYSDADWDSWMHKMKKKSKLKDDQYEGLKKYLDKMRAEK